MIFKESNGAVTFAVKLAPRSSKNEIVGIEGDALKIRLIAPPVEGKANAALVKFLADVFDVNRAQVEIVSGEKSKQKILRVRGVSATQAQVRTRP